MLPSSISCWVRITVTSPNYFRKLCSPFVNWKVFWMGMSWPDAFKYELIFSFLTSCTHWNILVEHKRYGHEIDRGLQSISPDLIQNKALVFSYFLYCCRIYKACISTYSVSKGAIVHVPVILSSDNHCPKIYACRRARWSNL